MVSLQRTQLPADILMEALEFRRFYITQKSRVISRAGTHRASALTSPNHATKYFHKAK